MLPLLVLTSDMRLARLLGAVPFVLPKGETTKVDITKIYFMSGSTIMSWPLDDIVLAETILAGRAAATKNK